MCLFLIAFDASSAFAISPESVALQTAAIGSKISDMRESAAAVGEAVQDKVNVAVDTVNHASEAATAALNQKLTSAQNAVQGTVTATRNTVNNAVETTRGAVNNAVHSTQTAVNNAYVATQEAVGNTYQQASNTVQSAANTVLAPVRSLADHVQSKFVLISDRLYQLVHTTLSPEPIYVPVSAATYTSPGVAVPANHQSTYGEVVSPYVYTSGGVDEYLDNGAEYVKTVVVAEETPKEGED